MRRGRVAAPIQVRSADTMPRQPPPPWTPPSPLPDGHTTARLVLRFWRGEDAPAMLEAIDVDRASLVRWMPWPAVDCRSRDECVYTIERFRRTRETADPVPTDFAMGIFDRTTGAPVGGTGYARVAAETGQAEVGYWIRADRRRSGLCTEAVIALVAWGLAPQSRGGWGFRRIVLYCAATNEASRRVAEKAGMRLELHARRDRWLEEYGWADTLGYAIDAEDGLLTAKS